MGQVNNKYSVEVEQSILGAILNNKSLFLVTKEQKITSEMFYFEKHKEIYKAMVQLVNKDLEIDLITLLEENKNNLDKMGNTTYLYDLSNSVPSTINFNQWLELLQDCYKKRCLIDIANYINTNLDKSTTTLTDNIQNEILNLFDDNKSMTIEEQIEDMIN
ncbi:MAG: DnaB-like helicase N-terminal domain-containing protein, partial [Sarcina sp.]